jgi:hypothetical protein
LGFLNSKEEARKDIMESILDTFLETHSLEEIVAGAPIEFEKIPDENQDAVVAILLHCCINGPVSPHKLTNYPIIGECRLDDIANQKISNNGLKKTCESVKKWLIDQDLCIGLMFNQFGGYWPNNEFISN